MPTWYSQITAMQEPFDMMMPDEAGRVRWAFNIFCIKGNSDTFGKDLAAILVAAGVGTWNATTGNIFHSSGKTLPQGDGPYLTIFATGGTSSLKTQDNVKGFPRPSAQIVARAKSSPVAEAMCRAAYNALVVVRNQDVTPVT